MQFSLTTDVLAWWGAIVATLVLIWDIIKWRREGVHLTVKIKAVDGLDGKFIRCEICNRGGKATTIKEVVLLTYQDKFFLRLFRMPAMTRALSFCADMNLPFRLDAGSAWIRTYEFPKGEHRSMGEDDYAELIEQGRLNYKVSFSHRSRSVRGRVWEEGIDEHWG